MKKHFLLFAIIFSLYSCAQRAIKPIELPKRDAILDSQPTEPSFPGGPEAFNNLIRAGVIAENIDCTRNERQVSSIEFVVEKDGSITDVKTSGKSSRLNTEALRVVESIRQKWTPGTLNDVNIRFRVHQTFSLVCE